MKTKFTPAPWALHINQKKVATISGDTRGWGMDHLVTMEVGSNSPTPDGCAEELKANAQLISAAPELYECLEELFMQTRLEVSTEMNYKILCALKKARGEQWEP